MKDMNEVNNMRDQFEAIMRKTFGEEVKLSRMMTITGEQSDGYHHPSVRDCWTLFSALAAQAQPTQTKQLSDGDIINIFWTLREKDKHCPLVGRQMSSMSAATLFAYGWKKAVEFDIKAQPAQEPARTKLVPMPTEESPRQWYFDCDGLYIDVEHLNGVVSIFAKHRGDNSVGWKELTEKSQAQEPESKMEKPTCRQCGAPFNNGQCLGDIWNCSGIHSLAPEGENHIGESNEMGKPVHVCQFSRSIIDGETETCSCGAWR